MEGDLSRAMLTDSQDGTGVRGYIALLILRKLVEAILKTEQKEDIWSDDHRSSGSDGLDSDPSKRSTNLCGMIMSPIKSIWKGSNLNTAAGSDSSGKTIREVYPLCDYFDLITGSSTGGLVYTHIFVFIGKPEHANTY